MHALRAMRAAQYAPRGKPVNVQHLPPIPSLVSRAGSLLGLEAGPACVCRTLHHPHRTCSGVSIVPGTSHSCVGSCNVPVSQVFALPRSREAAVASVSLALPWAMLPLPCLAGVDVNQSFNRAHCPLLCLVVNPLMVLTPSMCMQMFFLFVWLGAGQPSNHMLLQMANFQVTVFRSSRPAWNAPAGKISHDALRARVVCA